MSAQTAMRSDEYIAEASVPSTGAEHVAARWNGAALVGAVAAVTGLSAWGLSRHSLWLDEAISLGATNQLQDTLRNTAGTMGLYYVLLDAWTALFGTSVAALRSLSVVAVVGTVVVAGWLARRLLRPVESVVAVLLLGTSSGLVRYAQEARSYALVALLTAGAWAITTRALAARCDGDRNGAQRWWNWLAVLSIAGVTAHGMFPLQIAAITVAVALLPDRRDLVPALVPTLIATGTTVFCLALIGATDIANWVPDLSASQVGDLTLELLAFAPLAAVVMGLLATMGALTLVRRPAADSFQRWQNLAPVLWAFMPPLALVSLSVVRPYLVPRYVVASTPALMFLAAVGAVAVARRLSGPTSAPLARRRATVVGVALVVLGSVLAGQVGVHQRQGDNWRAAAKRVGASARPGDAIVFPTPPLRIPFEAAWREVVPAALPTPVGETRPLGQVRRFDDQAGPGAVDAVLTAAARIWVLHKTMAGAGDAPLEAFLSLDAVQARFRVVERWTVEGNVEVLLYQRAG